MLTCSECGQPGASYYSHQAEAWYHPYCFTTSTYIEDSVTCPSIDYDGEFLGDYSSIIGRRVGGSRLSAKAKASMRQVRLEVRQVPKPVSIPMRRL